MHGRKSISCTDEHVGVEINRKTMNGKPVYEILVKEVMNFVSKFGEKLLCDGITFSLGSACAYRCTFCYVEAMVRKHQQVVALQAELDARGLKFEDVVIIRIDALDIIREQLTVRRPGHVRLDEVKTVYTSPLVDCAANLVLAHQTIAACRIILALTNWHIRLLSKSNLLPVVAKALAEYRDRLVFGVSTGTLDDGLAAAFEQGTARVSKRIESLHWLQDNGFRTFGMICPSLPQEDYRAFAATMSRAIRADRCEHVWAEGMNLRGRSFKRTINALQSAGYAREAGRLSEVCGTGKKRILGGIRASDI